MSEHKSWSQGGLYRFHCIYKIKKNLPIFPLLWMCPGIIPILHSPGYNREILLCTIIHVEQQENLVHGMCKRYLVIIQRTHHINL
jgi:hypothetical protein